jgi:hypothetical protein
VGINWYYWVVMNNIYKKAIFDYEKKGMTLSEVIAYVRKNFTQTKPLPHYNFRIGETSFQVGPIKYTYLIKIESESIEVHDDFKLNFYVDIESEKSKPNHFLIEEKGIMSKSVAIFCYEEKDIPDFKQEIETHFKNHIKQLDLTKTDNLYDYLLNFYHTK